MRGRLLFLTGEVGGADTQTLEALHHRLARLLCYSRYGKPHQTPKRMDKAQNTADILEAMEENQDKAR